MNLDARLTTKQAADLIAVKPAVIRQWANRHIIHPACRTKRGWPLYRVGDILDADRKTREATRRNRKPADKP